MDDDYEHQRMICLIFFYLGLFYQFFFFFFTSLFHGILILRYICISFYVT